MIKQTKLAKAITYALAGLTLSAGSISTASATVTTMYNLTTSAGIDNSTNTTDPTSTGSWGLAGNTDGWLYGYKSSSLGTDTSIAQWAGTTGTNKTPFGYIGAQLNWGMEISGSNGGSGEISSYDAFNRYGTYADVDTAKGAWSDAALGTSGWRHDLEFGLFKSDTSGTVTLSAHGYLNTDAAFGFTIFKGMSTGLSYGHHGGWNPTNNVNGVSPASLPGGGTTFTVANIVAYSVGGANPQNLNTISFDAEAGQIYTIVLGGYRQGAYTDTVDGYSLTISQVPVPGAVWLFGSALAGFIGVQRRKKAVV